ncbi:MAG: CRISPR-associated helicase Cas3' [Pseudomonadota bacterium]
MKELFDKLTGGRGYQPYPYQERVAEVLFAGQNVILCAPTGAGKTWAGILPFLHAKQIGKPFSDRLIFALPLRTLATSMFEDTVAACQRAFGQDTVITTGKDRDYLRKDQLYVTIQTGEKQDDPFFEGDLIFTTIDQLLSSYIMMPVSLPAKVGNINAGVLPGAFLVFDEFHLLEPDKAMGTVLEMLDRLKPFCRFLVMTATMSRKSLEWLENALQAKPVVLPEEEIMALPTQRDKCRTFRWVAEPLTARHVFDSHSGGRSIVLVNTVRRAQTLYVELKEALAGTPTKVLLLHSRFYPDDRKRVESCLSEYLGKDATYTDVILVTTQVVEAGMDISAENLHTELAPMNSLVQRAGRCARYGGSRSTGTVWVYELERGRDGALQYGPYSERKTRLLVDESRAILEATGDGQLADFTTEREWVDQVHTSSELSALRVFENLYERRREVHEAMDGVMKDAVRQLIRDIASIVLIITDEPESLRFERAVWPRMLSIPRTSLCALNEVLGNKTGGGWVAKIPSEENSPAFGQEWGWAEVTRIDEFLTAPWLIVIHPNFASYTSDIGLQLGIKGETAEVVYNQKALLPRYQLEYESFRTHTERVAAECRKMAACYEVAAEALEGRYHLDQGRCEQLIELACRLHDVGKLTRRWQSAMRAWQEYKHPARLLDEPLAHTDYDPEIDWKEIKRFPQRGPHAMEGAFAVGHALLDQGLGDDFAAVLWTVIARHHGARTRNLDTFELIDKAGEVVRDSVSDIFRERVWQLESAPDRRTREGFSNDLISFVRAQDQDLWPLYVVIARRVRLADQGSLRK